MNEDEEKKLFETLNTEADKLGKLVNIIKTLSDELANDIIKCFMLWIKDKDYDREIIKHVIVDAISTVKANLLLITSDDYDQIFKFHESSIENDRLFLKQSIILRKSLEGDKTL